MSLDQAAAPFVSLVIPLFNERENLPHLHRELCEVLDPAGLRYEVVAVDDGSTDGTREGLEAIWKEDPRWVVVILRRNFGQTAALSAGFDQARGEVIVTLDGDLQHDPRDIPRLVEMARDYDVVSGWRHPRRDPLLSRRLPSYLANGLISWVTGVRLHDSGCTLKAYRREVVQCLRLYGDLHRFIPAIASSLGATIAEVQIRHRPRRFGRSKYGLARTVRVLLDLITVKFLLSFMTKPIQVFGLLGLLSGAAGVAIAAYLSALKLLAGQEIGGRPLLLMAVLLMLLGMQLVGMGLLGEMLARVYHEAQNKPIYVVKRVLGRDEGPAS